MRKHHKRMIRTGWQSHIARQLSLAGTLMNNFDPAKNRPRGLHALVLGLDEILSLWWIIVFLSCYRWYPISGPFGLRTPATDGFPGPSMEQLANGPLGTIGSKISCSLPPAQCLTALLVLLGSWKLLCFWNKYPVTHFFLFTSIPCLFYSYIHLR